MSTASTPFARFLRLFNPILAGRDFLRVWNQENPYRWRFVAVAAAMTFCVFSVMFAEEHRIEPRAPDITIIETLDPDRTNDEIMAENIANQERKDKARAEQEARNREVREVYEAIGRASGMDIEEARRQGDRERTEAARQREEAQRNALERLERSRP